MVRSMASLGLFFAARHHMTLLTTCLLETISLAAGCHALLGGALLRKSQDPILSPGPATWKP